MGARFLTKLLLSFIASVAPSPPHLEIFTRAFGRSSRLGTVVCLAMARLGRVFGADIPELSPRTFNQDPCPWRHMRLAAFLFIMYIAHATKTQPSPHGGVLDAPSWACLADVRLPVSFGGAGTRPEQRTPRMHSLSK